MVRTVFAAIVGFIVACAGVLFFVWLLWWLWSRREEKEKVVDIELKLDEPPVEAEPPAVEAQVEQTPEEQAELEEAPALDDLKRIEGIGPKIASVLQAAGITTFAQLADSDVAHLQQVLEEEDPRLRRLAKPASWPEQAALAAAGEWDALAALQGELKGGRRA